MVLYVIGQTSSRLTASEIRSCAANNGTLTDEGCLEGTVGTGAGAGTGTYVGARFHRGVVMSNGASLNVCNTIELS